MGAKSCHLLYSATFAGQRRKVLGAISEFDKALTVAKLRGAPERKRRATPPSSRQSALPAIDDLYPGYPARRRAARRSGLSRSDLVHWH